MRMGLSNSGIEVRKSDVIVLGAGIVGTSIALHLAKRGLAVRLIDKRGPGQETSFGNAGVIEGNTLFPPAFPNFKEFVRIATKRATQAEYHVSHLPHAASWLLSYYRNTRPAKLVETAITMRPLFERAVAEHMRLMTESDAMQYVNAGGWLKVYRTEKGFSETARELELAQKFGVPYRIYEVPFARQIEPCLSSAFERAIHWTGVVNIKDPLRVTEAYARRFELLKGSIIKSKIDGFEKKGTGWSVMTSRGTFEADHVVVALGPWSPDFLKPHGISLPLGIKRGYHYHFARNIRCDLKRPVLDVEVGYCMTPMNSGIRVTTGAEFAARDALPTPVQFGRVLPRANELISLGKPLEDVPWMGCRPCFADSRPVIGPAPGFASLWLAYGHGHSGLTLGPVTGRLIAEMITKTTLFCDPEPYSAERFFV